MRSRADSGGSRRSPSWPEASPLATWPRHVHSLVRWLETSLTPHIAWEDQWLYPRLAERVGSDWPTRLMRFEHAQIRRAICALEVDLDGLRREPLHGQLTRLRADLYRL